MCAKSRKGGNRTEAAAEQILENPHFLLHFVNMDKSGNDTAKSVEERIVSRLTRFADALEANKNIAKEFTCRTVVFDLEPVAYNRDMVKATRRLLGASQIIFARFLGVSAATVRGWEQGAVAPGRMACRFLDEIQRNPDFWRRRLNESVRIKREIA